MRTNLFFWIFTVVLVCNTSFSQQLVINEVSQGPSGSKEYVELVVVGTPTCNAIPCIDIREYIIDDNNGNHATGGGTGIASGCVRFKNIPFWSCIPIGTMILIYNDADINALVPAIDLSMTDGNCKLVIPISECTLLERHTALPTVGTPAYPTTGYTNCGNWTPVSMANGDDSFQTINPTGGVVHCVSWGNNNLSTVIYFAGSAAGKVALMNNSVDNNPANQANWTFMNVPGNETPGSPNNAANNNWIHSMNNSCVPLLPLSATVSFSNSGCICNGSATLNASGAISPYTYTWLPSGGNANIAAGLCGGTYTVQSTSSNGCTQSHTVTIGTFSSLTLSITNNSVTCNGLSNGSATVTAIGGTLPYSYTWTPVGGNSQSASGLAAGVYTVIVKDANNCTSIATTSIAQPTAALSAIVSSTNNLCFGGSTGAASVTPNGGAPGYTYTWSPSGGNSSLVNGLSAGIYTVLINDVNNCATTITTSISQPATGLIANISATNNVCFGASNGIANVSMNGGSGPYSYTWWPGGGNSAIVTGLSAGTYSVLINDINNCILTASVSISQPTSGINAVISTTNVLCSGALNGAVSVNVNGGTPGYTYTYSPTGGNTSYASALAAGNYSVFIKDVNSCNAIVTFSISSPQPLLLSVNALTLCSGQQGILTSTLLGGFSPFIYNWNGTSTLTNTITVTATTTTVYPVSVTDANGCVSNLQNASINIAGLVTLSVTPGFSICNGAAATLSANASGGNGNYNFIWQPGGMNGPIQVISNVTASQVYTVSVTDGCSGAVTKTIDLVSLPNPQSNIITSETKGCEPLCVTFSNTPLLTSGLVQTYQWNFGDNNSSALSSPEHCYNKSGNYSVILNYVTINGCVGSQTLSNYIQVNPIPIAEFTSDISEIDIYNTSVNFINQSSGATQYNWFFSNEGTSELPNPVFTFSNEQDQFIYLFVKNEFGCTDTITKKIKYITGFTFFAPNTFTPNEDNLNDTFLPKGIGWNIDKYELSIYDRWGEKIFGTKQYNEGWNGKVRGSESSVQNDIYIWKVSLTDMFSKYHEFVGHIFIEK
ncbi:MAG: gliding motility-associated C-terminal domain-containing protein [Bacteroidota bacterium]|nr:gliding motility-associated C-terminal domain-containing protein [Bacteroidota bacterium]